MQPDQHPAEELPTLQFSSQHEWEAWLEKNHRNSKGVWLRLSKKVKGSQAMVYAEALEAALCYGWIDGQKRRGGATDWLQKFTPRTKKSIWSKINREKAMALIESGRMRAAGAEEVERAKHDGRWAAAYDSPSNSTVPLDFQAALDENPAAKAFFETLEKRNRYALLFRIQTVKKAETRARRIREFIDMLVNRKKFH